MTNDPSEQPLPLPPEPDPVAGSDADPEHERRPGSGLKTDPGMTEIAVEVSDTQSHLRIDPDDLARLVRATLKAEGVGRASVSVAVVDDPTIREVNRRHLDHDWPTDVVSFVLSDPDEPELSGELVVSAETAVATARRAGVAPWDELALYVVHGLLHLCGHDDTTDRGRAAMRRREGEVLEGLGLTNTFPAAEVGAGDRVREASR
jgi:probable rRNA maturation factor